MKHLIWVLFVFAGISYASAQDVYTSSGKPGYHKKATKKKGYDPDKLILGGGITLQIGSGMTALGAAPIVGYRITDHFSAGVGLGYLFARSAIGIDPYNSAKLLYVTDNIIYPSVWARYFVFRNIYLTSTFEYDIINQKYPVDNYGNVVPVKSTATNQCLWMGVGLKQPLGGRVYLFGELVYDVLQGKNSPYQPGMPDVHFGIAAGL
jgi:hypothetical protein